jgi:hypothetical protein
MTALLGHRAYVFFWCTRLSAQLAAQMLMVALGWQMYDLTGSAWDLGLVGLAQFLPAMSPTATTAAAPCWPRRCCRPAWRWR